MYITPYENDYDNQSCVVDFRKRQLENKTLTVDNKNRYWSGWTGVFDRNRFPITDTEIIAQDKNFIKFNEDLDLWIKHNAAAFANFTFDFCGADAVKYVSYHNFNRPSEKAKRRADALETNVSLTRAQQILQDAFKKNFDEATNAYMLSAISDLSAAGKIADSNKNRRGNTIETTVDTTTTPPENNLNNSTQTNTNTGSIATSAVQPTTYNVPPCLVNFTLNDPDAEITKNMLEVFNNRRNLIVYLDNGHSMNTDGKQSPDSTLFEWKWNRLFVDFLQAVLLDLGFSAFRLITEDKRVIDTGVIGDKADNGDLDLRYKRVQELDKFLLNKNSKRKAIAISVHINAGTSKWSSDLKGAAVKIPGWKGRGFSVYTSRAIDKCDILAKCLNTECLGQKINTINGSTIFNVTYKNESGKDVKDQKGFDDNPHANFGVQTSLSVCNQLSKVCPTVLTENLFMDNKNDLERLKSVDTFLKLIRVHALGIFEYFSKTNKITGTQRSGVTADSDGTTKKVTVTNEGVEGIGTRKEFESQLELAIENRKIAILTSFDLNILKLFKGLKFTDAIIKSTVGLTKSTPYFTGIS